MSNIEYTMVIGDLHIPFQNEKALRRYREWLASHPYVRDNVTTLVYNGDIVDFYTVSHFKKNPSRKQDIADEMHIAETVMKRINSYFPKLNRVIFNEGNHEFRLETYMWSHAPEVYNILEPDIYSLMHLDEHGVDRKDYYRYQDYPERVYKDKGKIMIVHTVNESVSKYSGYTASNLIRQYGVNVIIGHNHRLGLVYHRNYGKQLVGVEGGCFCNLNPEYARSPNWQNGFSYIEWDGMAYKINIVRI